MENFIYNIPTKVAFGKGQISMLPEFIKEYGKKVLLLYGGGRIKKNGIYDKAVSLLKENDIEYFELPGVEPNPQIATVRKGVEICKKEGIEVLIPIGGGSTIDCAKAVAAGAFYDGDPWDIVKDNSLLTDALPIVAVLTIAATGSEMDSSSVISNEAEKDKTEINDERLFPKASILDPTYTFTVSPYQTAAGVADIMSHIFEYYFSGEEILTIQRDLMTSILKVCIKYGPVAVKEPDNFEARANLMWAATWAINGFVSCGVYSGWPCHAMEYQITNRFDLTHGHGMAIINNAWLNYKLNEKTLPLYVAYAREVFGIEEEDAFAAAKKAVQLTGELYEDIGLTLTLRSVGIEDESVLRGMAEQAVEEFGLTDGTSQSLTMEDVEAIYKLCF